MGFGALIGAGISAVGSIAGGLLSSQGGGGGGGPDAGTLKRARQIYIDRFVKDPGFWNLNMPGMADLSMQYGFAHAPEINQFNQQQLTNLLNQVIPGYQGMMGQMGKNVSSELAGNVPQDVQEQIQRSGAYQALTSGIGAGGAGTGLQGKTITARDLGLTSLNLMQQGQQGLGNLLGLTNYTMAKPVNPLSLLPMSDLVAGEQWSKQAEFQANLAGYTAAAQQAGMQIGFPSQMGNTVSGIGGTLGGFLQGLGQQNPQTGQSGYSLLSSLFGGGGGNLGGAFGSSSELDPFSGTGSLSFNY